MVAAAVAVDLGRAAEVGEEHHERLVEHAAHLEIGQQGGDGAVEHRQQPVFHLWKVIAVRVPVIATASREVARGTYGLHHRHTGLNETPRQQ